MLAVRQRISTTYSSFDPLRSFQYTYSNSSLWLHSPRPRQYPHPQLSYLSLHGGTASIQLCDDENRSNANSSCLLVDNPTRYASFTLSAARCRTPNECSSDDDYPSEQSCNGKFQEYITQCGVNFGEKQVQSFTIEEVNALADKIKEDWDRAGVRGYGYLKAQAEKLPALLR